MKILGIDPSSSCCGVAIVEDGNILITDAWIKPKTGSAADRLLSYSNWLTFFVGTHQPNVASIEYLSVSRNAESTRVISHYQAISALVCKKLGLMIVEGRVKSARKIVLGNGALSKEEAFKLVKQKFPQHKFGRWQTPGADETDAAVMALAGVELAER